MSNRHPADQLAAVRAELAQLKRREGELRYQLLTSRDLRGDQWTAYIQEQARRRLDVASARAGLGEDTLAPYWVSSSTTFVKLRPLRIALKPYRAPDPVRIARRGDVL
jgi:hypothetical protein